MANRFCACRLLAGHISPIPPLQTTPLDPYNVRTGQNLGSFNMSVLQTSMRTPRTTHSRVHVYVVTLG
jgi:hypothetical protein